MYPEIQEASLSTVIRLWITVGLFFGGWLLILCFWPELFECIVNRVFAKPWGPIVFAILATIVLSGIVAKFGYTYSRRKRE